MSWRNVKLIYAREIRDQLRDRRTLFMIAVLPLLAVSAVGHERVSALAVSAEERIAGAAGGRGTSDGRHRICRRWWRTASFADELFDDPTESRAAGCWRSQRHRHDRRKPRRRPRPAQVRRRAGRRSFSGRLRRAARTAARRRCRSDAAGAAGDRETDAIRVPQPEILFNSAREKSRIADRAVERVLNNWKAQVVRQNLLAGRVPENVARPFQVKPLDVAEPRQQEAVVWAKIVPFVLFIWALTGAFYPAVDLCAGEKERGTLETLLSSPALRSEIVWGKLLTVMTFSMATALLNLTSLGVTADTWSTSCKSLTPGDVDVPVGLPAAGRDRLPAGRAGADVGPVQRAVPGLRRVCPQHEGRPVLPDAAACW